MELVSKSMDLLGHGNEVLWEAFTQDLKTEIEQILMAFSEDDKIISFGPKSDEEERQDLIALKHWLMTRKGPA